MSPLNSPSLPPFTVPPGWTREMSSPDIRHEWEGHESEGPTLARQYGLGPAWPVMEDTEASFTIFQSDGKFYLWQRMEDDLYEIGCRDICEIALKISQSKFRDLRVDRLPPPHLP
ncbi:hypothetical protein N7453_002346 [Penicillium expansum]|nr:hypothetical protein N7453_002346 [Penicillium expansum]